jgi:hypothetical protein
VKTTSVHTSLAFCQSKIRPAELPGGLVVKRGNKAVIDLTTVHAFQSEKNPIDLKSILNGGSATSLSRCFVKKMGLPSCKGLENSVCFGESSLFLGAHYRPNRHVSLQCETDIMYSQSEFSSILKFSLQRILKAFNRYLSTQHLSSKVQKPIGFDIANQGTIDLIPFHFTSFHLIRLLLQRLFIFMLSSTEKAE